MNDEQSEFSAIGKNINETLYSENRVSNIAKELGYSNSSGMSGMIEEIRAELLQDNRIIIVNTGTADDAVEVFTSEDIKSVDKKILTGMLEKDDTVVTNENDVISFLKTKPEELGETLKTQGYNFSDEQVGTLKKALQTAKDKLPNKANKMFKLATGTVKVASKTAKVATKTHGALVRLGKNLNVFDAEGKVNAIEVGGNQLKTAANFVGRNAVVKPTAKVAKKINNKIAQKAVNKAVLKVKKLEAKMMAKAAKISAKAGAKAAKVAIKVISKLLQALVKALVACWPLAVALLVVIIVVIVVTSIFGAGLGADDMEKFTTYVSETQTEMQESIDYYAQQGYKVDGTYSGTAYIDWKAALSVLQGLKSGNITGGKEEINLLKEWQSDGTMYKIDRATTTEYVLKPEVKDKDGNVIQNEVRTTTKYVVTIGTLDDYKDWVKNNPDYIKKFYKKANINYDENCTNFLTDEVVEIADRLYASDEFDTLFEGISFDTSNIAPGTIYDTGEHSGKLAYPTSSRKISADFPTYPSGKSHTGIDFPVPKGTPVCAAYDGTVYITKNLETSYGHYVVLKHNIDGQTIYTLYAHNTTLLVSKGQTVKQGQVIAYSGSTGNSTGPHCHFSVLTSYSPQKYVDPKAWL